MPHIHSIYRYPIKGLSAEALHGAALAPGQTIPGDRLYAIENGPSGFDPVKRPYLSKQHFLMLMKNERLAGLRTSFDDKTHTLSITCPSPLWGGEGVGVAKRRANVDALTLPHDPPPHPPPTSLHSGARERGPGGGREISADLRSAAGRATIENFFADYCADELRGPPRILHADGHSFSDVARKVVSIINLASVAAVEDMVGAPVDPLRFRGNVYVEGWPAWSELDLVGKELTISRFPSPLAGEDQGGGARLQSRQADRPLRRHQCRSRNRHPRPRNTQGAAAPSRPRRLRDLCGGGRRRRHRGGGCDGDCVNP